MKAWLANLLWDALWLCLWRGHDWVFDPERAARIRFANRERWWAYHQKALTSLSKKDDMRADSWRIQFDFKTPPGEAVRRGDLDPHARRLAMAAVEKARSHP
ncbi:MAG: hypothetical protein V2A79_09855 [Planctomycetota bacterium]